MILLPMLAETFHNGCQNLALGINSHAQELKRTSSLEIDVMIFTNLLLAHLDFSGNFDDDFSGKESSTI
jgi:UDP-N-acetylmuramyl tripeptide synthase